MAASYSDKLRLILPATADTLWGDSTNSNMGTLLEEAICGVAAVTMTDANYTLSTANGATDEARKAVIQLTGTLSAGRNLVVPTKSKLYMVFNNTTGGQIVTVKTSAGTGIAVPAGSKKLMYCDGTNVVDHINDLPSGTLLNGTALTSTFQSLNSNTTSWAAITRASGFDTFVATPSSANLRALITDESGSGALLFASGALGTPASGTLTNCTGLPIAGLDASTSTAIGVGSIELGHASANTLTATSGVLSIEGNVIPHVARTNTFTAQQIINSPGGADLLTMQASSGGIGYCRLKTQNGGGNWGGLYVFQDTGSGGGTSYIGGIANGQEMRFGFTAGNYFVLTETGAGFYPSYDNGWNLGGASNRWGNVYAGNGTIITSDAREKTPLKTIPPGVTRAVLATIKRVGMYQWLQAVADKGKDGARLHFGPTAQILKEEFEREGIDGFLYGMLCSDAINENYYAQEEYEAPVEAETEEKYLEISGEGNARVAIMKTRTVMKPVLDVLPVLDEAGEPHALTYREQRTEKRTRQITLTRPKIDPETGEQYHRLGIRTDQIFWVALAALVQAVKIKV